MLEHQKNKLEQLELERLTIIKSPKKQKINKIQHLSHTVPAMLNLGKGIKCIKILLLQA